MKYVLAVLIFFSLLSLGIGVYFFQRSQSVSTAIKAADSTQALGILIDDCYYRYLHPCKNSPDGIGLDAYILSETQKVLRTHADRSVEQYTESPDRSIFHGTKLPSSVQLRANSNVSQIIQAVSLATHIHYKLLLSLFVLQANSAWEGRATLSDAFGRDEFSLTGQLLAVAKDLSDFLQSELDSPSTFVTVEKKDYLLEPNLNPSSRALYVYLATTAKSSAEFEQVISLYNTSNPRNFWNIWRSLFQEPSFSDRPFTPNGVQVGVENLLGQ